MFVRCCGGGVGRGNSAAVAEITVDPEEIVYESPDTHFKFENTDEETANIHQAYLT